MDLSGFPWISLDQTDWFIHSIIFFLFLDTRKYNYQNEFKKVLRNILPDIRSGNRSMNEIGDLIANYTRSPFAKSRLEPLFETRTKEIRTIEEIVY